MCQFLINNHRVVYTDTIILFHNFLVLSLNGNLVLFLLISSSHHTCCRQAAVPSYTGSIFNTRDHRLLGNDIRYHYSMPS